MRLSRLHRMPDALAWFLLLASVAAAPGCEKTLDVVCRSELPRFERRIDHAIAALEASSGNNSSVREPASISELPPILAKSDRRDWQLWAKHGLYQAQEAIDIVSAQPGLGESRERLMAVANGLVVFHGFSSQGDSLKMIQALRRVRDDVGNAGRLGCSGSSR